MITANILYLIYGFGLMSFTLNAKILTEIGILSMFFYIYNWIPQIIKNFKEKQGNAFNIIFLLLNIIAIICDEIYAMILKWPLSSICSPIVILI